jgi:Flp pilus assembly protein TadG
MRRLRGDSERGAMSALVVVLFVFLMILAGLVVDGGNAINARQRAIDDAEQAARVAANQIDMGQLRADGQVTIMWPDAGAAARTYLGERGYSPGNVQVVPAAGGGVTVTVESTVRTQLLSLAFIPTFTVTGRATALPAVGIDQEIQ